MTKTQTAFLLAFIAAAAVQPGARNDVETQVPPTKPVRKKPAKQKATA